jgi:hypothetical protein
MSELPIRNEGPGGAGCALMTFVGGWIPFGVVFFTAPSPALFIWFIVAVVATILAPIVYLFVKNSESADV